MVAQLNDIENIHWEETIKTRFSVEAAVPQPYPVDKSETFIGGQVVGLRNGLMTASTNTNGVTAMGLCALTINPSVLFGRNDGWAAMWIGGKDSEFDILTGAHAVTLNAMPTDGTLPLLTQNANGLLTNTGATAANAVATLKNISAAAAFGIPASITVALGTFPN
jgi:hypothetical protein